MTSTKRILFVVFILTILTGIAIGLVGRSICTRDNENYQKVQVELFAPDEIATVLHDEDLHQIYVCYNDASYVNVYSEEGRFLWAVSTPYLRNVYFELSNNQLIVYNSADAYIYDSSNGTFVEKKKSDDIDLIYDWENEYTDKFQNGEFYFDTYQVYKAQEDGSLTTVVARPWWYWVFNFGVCWCVSFVGAIGMGSIIFLEKRKEYRKTQDATRYSKQTTVIENRKARFILKYFRIISIIHVIYAIFDIVFGLLLNGILCIGILPLAIHFIISNIVIWNMLDHIRLTEDEQTIIDYWKVCETGTFIIAFLSVIVAAMLA